MRHLLSVTALAASLALAIGNMAQADHEGYYGQGASYGFGNEPRYHAQLNHNSYHRNMNHGAYHDSLNHSAFDRQFRGYSSSNGSGYGGYSNFGSYPGYGRSGYSSYPRSYGGW